MNFSYSLIWNQICFLWEYIDIFKSCISASLLFYIPLSVVFVIFFSLGCFCYFWGTFCLLSIIPRVGYIGYILFTQHHIFDTSNICPQRHFLSITKRSVFFFSLSDYTTVRFLISSSVARSIISRFDYIQPLTFGIRFLVLSVRQFHISGDLHLVSLSGFWSPQSSPLLGLHFLPLAITKKKKKKSVAQLYPSAALFFFFFSPLRHYPWSPEFSQVSSGSSHRLAVVTFRSLSHTSFFSETSQPLTVSLWSFTVKERKIYIIVVYRFSVLPSSKFVLVSPRASFFFLLN